MAEEALNILMMGGRRAGKTSALAGLFDSFLHSPSVTGIVRADDSTEGGDGACKLSEKIENMKIMLREKNGKVIMVDEGSTNSLRTYSIKLRLPNSGHSMTLRFTDVNGEFYEEGKRDENGNLFIPEIEQLINECQVFVIAIDTPFLMESANGGNPLCTNGINMSYNRVGTIQNFLTCIDDHNGHDAKMVIFVPIKCEWWMKHGRAEDVVARVEKVYSTPIATLSSYSHMEIGIIPIQTIGSMVYDGQLPAMLWHGTPCSPLSDDTVRFGEGVEKSGIQTADLQIDPNAIIPPGNRMLRPNTWFRVTDSDYEPHNCEQLAFHILQFVMKDYIRLNGTPQKIDINKIKSEGRRLGRNFRDFVSSKVFKVVLDCSSASNAFEAKRISKNILEGAGSAVEIMADGVVGVINAFLGDVSIDEMRMLIEQMEANGLIIENQEGIKRVKRCNFQV